MKPVSACRGLAPVGEAGEQVFVGDQVPAVTSGIAPPAAFVDDRGQTQLPVPDPDLGRVGIGARVRAEIVVAATELETQASIGC